MVLSPTGNQPTNVLRRYAAESTRPFVCLAFVAPILLIYELGTILLGPHALRNGADTWLRHLLESLGFGQYLLLPLLTCGLLLGWHHTRHDGWSLPGRVLATMLFESLFFAMILFGLAHAQRAWFAPAPHAIVGSGTCPLSAELVSRLIGYCGAGIYEELLFRLMLLPAVAYLLKSFSLTWRSSWIGGILATSVIFSAAHYEWFAPGGYAFDWYSFSFRFTAGIFFAALFVSRGFGITAGAHTFYDMLVEIAQC